MKVVIFSTVLLIKNYLYPANFTIDHDKPGANPPSAILCLLSIGESFLSSLALVGGNFFSLEVIFLSQRLKKIFLKLQNISSAYC